MLSAILAFLGSNFARMVWGEFSDWFTKSREHARELDRLEAQGRLEAQLHSQRMEMARFEAERGVQVIEIQGKSDLDKLDAQAFLQAVTDVRKQTGIKWVDAWNACIQPGLATWSIVMLTGECCSWWMMSDDVRMLTGAALGIYVANRHLFKRSK
jgi:hypothetical protein